jgi:cobalt-zinc-cadmium resistance protein CzcA
MQKAVESALTNNPEIKKAESKTASAKARQAAAFALSQPELSLSYEYIPTGKAVNQYGERTIEIKQELEFPVKYFQRSDLSAIESRISLCEYNASRLDIICRVRLAYLEALAKTELLKLAENNLSVADTFYKKAETRYKLGEASNIEKMTAKVQYVYALNSVESQQSILKFAFDELTALVYGSVRLTNYILSDTLGYTPVRLPDDSLAATAQRLNPQLMIDRLKYEAASSRKKMAWSSLLPDFSISYARQSQAGNNSYYGASAGVKLPLWFAFDQKNKIEEAAADEKTGDAELRSSLNTVILRVNSAYTELRNAQKQVMLFIKEIIPQSNEILRNAGQSYSAGEISYLEFLQAKQISFDARSGYINALLAYNQACVKLDYAVGGNILKTN